MYRFLWLFLTVLLLKPVLYLSAGEIKPIKLFQHFDSDDGLTTKTVYSFLQDHDGFMWFCTDDGVFRYDGNRFSHITVNDGLSDNEVFQIYLDRYNRLWFLTLNGNLCFWKDGKMHNQKNTPFLKKTYKGGSIISAYEDQSGKLWLGGFGSGVFNIDDTVVNTVYLPVETRNWVAPYIYEGEEGHISFFSKKLMINLTTKDTGYINNGVVRFAQIRNTSTAYFNDLNGIFKIENGKINKLIDTSEVSFDNKIINLLATGDSLWICTFEGCYLYKDRKMIARFHDKLAVSTVKVDREGNLWFSTLNDGVFMLPKTNNSFTNYNQNSGLSENELISIARANDNSIYVGYNNGIVDHIINNTKVSYNLKNKSDPSFFRVMDLVTDKNILWCGTDRGAYYISSNKINRIPFGIEKDNSRPYGVKQVITGINNEHYLTMSLNFAKISKHNNEWYADNMIDTIFRTFSGIVINENKFLISSYHGLFEFSPGKYLVPYSNDTALFNVRIIDLKFDTDSLLLLLTNNKGIYILKNRRIFQHITTTEGLSDNNCKRFFLKDNNLFVATGNGLSILEKKSSKWEIQQIIYAHNGILSSNINDLTVDSKNIYLATEKGLSVINREFMQFEIFSTQVKITEIVTDSIIRVNQNSYSVEADVPRLLIRFAYPVYNPINKYVLKYRLKENASSNGEWNTTHNNEVEFSSLLPGTYFFEITPDIPNNKGEISTLQINIIPKWWQTSTARVFAIVFLTTGLLYYGRRRVKQQYEKRLTELRQQSMIESERTRIASDMHDDIGGDLTQISIWLNILKQKELPNNPIVKKVTTLSKEVLSKMDQIIWALNSVHNTSQELFSYLHSYASECLESSGITLKFIVADDLPEINISAILRRNVFLVVKELLHNTIKHSKANLVTIRISFQDKKFEIEYSDNGTGFSINSKTYGLGLINLKKRMDEINSDIRIVTSPGNGLQCYLTIFPESQLDDLKD